MRKAIIVLSAALTMILTVVVLRTYSTPAQPQAVRPTLNDLVVGRVIFLESSGRHDGLWGDDYTSYGCCQFQLRTFNWMKGLAGMGWLDWKNRDDQVLLLAWAVENGYGHHWTTYQQAVDWAAKEAEK